ncbi:MAG: flagellar assembly protein FliW [Phycisphaerae bacterium]|nr:flagellar assembly protein FliW [Gemmatimonadaceae bacterium]
MTVAAAATHTFDSATTTEITLDSVVLGQVQVSTSSVFQFTNGLHGFETHLAFALVPAAREGLFWLQSVTSRDVVFLLIDPFVAAPGFEVDLGVTERAMLKLDNPMDVLVLAIVTLPAGNEASPTANLRGPIVLNAQKRLASQIMSAVQAHDVRTPVDLHALPARS